MGMGYTDKYTDVYMELAKKTTILFPPELYDRLAALAKERGKSVGDLVREACRKQYFSATPKSRLAAVAELAAMRLPVGSPAQIEAESTSEPLP